MYKNLVDYHKDLEKAILGIFLLEPQSFGACRGLVEEESFYFDPHKEVFKAINETWENKEQVDVFSVSRKLVKKGILEMGYGNDFGPTDWFLCYLMKEVVSSAHIESWCLILKELFAIRIMKEANSMSINPEDDVFEKSNIISEKLKKALEIKTVNDWVSVKDVSKELIDKINTQNGDSSGVPTGSDKIDKLNGGFKAGMMIVIGARPGVGKSAYMGCAVQKALKKGLKVGIISLEMQSVDVFARMVSAESGVEFWKIERKMHTDIEAKTKVLCALANMQGQKLYFSDKAKVTANDIRSKAEKLKRSFNVDEIWIDYLQLVESEGGKNKSRENEVAAISRAIKLIAMDLKIPVIVLAQLNRQATGEPELTHLRESGAIEQDADVVMFLHREMKEDENGEESKEAKVLVRKWRNGNGYTHDIMGFDKETMKFYDKEECEPFTNNFSHSIQFNRSNFEPF